MMTLGSQEFLRRLVLHVLPPGLARITAMRTATGIVLTAFGAIGLAISGSVLLRLPLPGSLLRHLGIFGVYIHSVERPVFSLVFLIVGVFPLLRSKQPSAT
jgi:hypothetical protein